MLGMQNISQRAAAEAWIQSIWRVFIEKKKAQCLMPLSDSECEYVEFILDSGVTTIVIPPHVGKAYDIQPSEASKA